MNDSIFLSIVIPAYNEAERILPTLEKVYNFLSLQSYISEVFIVDDASSDETARLVDEFINGKLHFRLIKNEINLGKGASVKRGMSEAKGKWRLFMDADSSTAIEEINQFLAIEGTDVFIGSRRVVGHRIIHRQPIFREASGRIFSIIVRFFILHGFFDTQCGFKMFSARAANEIFPRQTIPGFGFDVEILYIAKKKGFRMLEIGVTWTDSPSTRVHLFRDAPQMLIDLFRIRLNDLRSLYQ